MNGTIKRNSIVLHRNTTIEANSEANIPLSEIEKNSTILISADRYGFHSYGFVEGAGGNAEYTKLFGSDKVEVEFKFDGTTRSLYIKNTNEYLLNVRLTFLY